MAAARTVARGAVGPCFATGALGPDLATGIAFIGACREDPVDNPLSAADLHGAAPEG
jgi:hypothetical protein